MKISLLPLAVLFALPASADLVSVNYSGTITASQLSSIPVGSPFSGSFSYEMSAVGTLFGAFTRYGAPGDSASAGSQTGTSSAGFMSVYNDYQAGLNYIDALQWQSGGSVTFSAAVAADLAGLNLFNRFFNVTLRTNSPTSGSGPLSSMALPNPLPSFDTMYFEIGGTRNIEPIFRTAGGPITSITVTPEPATIALAGLTFAAAALRLRLRRTAS